MSSHKLVDTHPLFDDIGTVGMIITTPAWPKV